VAKLLVFNGDDFGASAGINRGIIQCHIAGPVTSASLMVTGAAVADAVAMSRDHPGLAIGLHWDVCGEDDRPFDLDDVRAVREEFHRQLGEFERITGRLPTHIDSHRHVHLSPQLLPIFQELVAPFGTPLRGDGRVNFVGGFYAQWEWRITNLEYVSVAALQRMLREEAIDGWNEFSCHPGFMTDDYVTVYGTEREAEVRTLTNPAIRSTIDALGIRLVSYADFPRTKSPLPSRDACEDLVRRRVDK
jgi:predicted glycoside hydrolase/deacetylase ChbG (UPF0249 family)